MNIVLFGGSFDPIHHGHLICLRCVFESIAPYSAYGIPLSSADSKILLVPTAASPYKERSLAPFGQRCDMIKLCIGENEPFELFSEDQTYTIDTVKLLLDRYKEKEPVIHLVIGSDWVKGLEKWKQIDELLSLVHLAVVARPGYNIFAEDQYLSSAAKSLTFFDLPQFSVSSTDIRERVAKGKSIRYLVPDAVEQYIKTHGLYRNIEKD